MREEVICPRQVEFLTIVNLRPVTDHGGCFLDSRVAGFTRRTDRGNLPDNFR